MFLIDSIFRRKKSEPVIPNPDVKIVEPTENRRTPKLPSSFFDYDEDEEYCWELDDDDDDDD